MCTKYFYSNLGVNFCLVVENESIKENKPKLKVTEGFLEEGMSKLSLKCERQRASG